MQLKDNTKQLYILITWLVCIFVIILRLKNSLIYGISTFHHDNYYWSFPIFHYFSVNISNFQFPFWNPYSHGGEPFYPLLGTIRLLDPIVYPIILIASALGLTSVQTFAWNRIIGALIYCFFTYKSVSKHAEHYITKITLIPVIVLSSYVFSTFRQEGAYLHAFWIPFIYFFWQKIVVDKNFSPANWIGISLSLGVNWLCYFFAESWLMIFVLTTSYLIFKKESPISLIKENRKNLITSSVILLLMLLPSIVLYTESNDYIYPARQIPQDMKEKIIGGSPTYESSEPIVNQPLYLGISFAKASGTFSSLWDFVFPIYIKANHFLGLSQMRIGFPSEIPIYFGLLAWSIGILGIISGSHPLKKIWLSGIIFFTLFQLGPDTGILQFLYIIFPPARFIRHTHLLAPYFHFFFFFFFV